MTSERGTYNDRPVRHLKQDALNFSDYAPALKKIATTGDTPLTIGVFGAWGSGKSSLMRMLRQSIEDDEKFSVRTVWFTAWKYDRQEVLWRALILRVLEALYPREPGEGAREERPVVKNPGEREQKLIALLDRLSEAVYRPVSWEEIGPRNIKWWQLISGVGEASVDIVANVSSAGLWSKIKESLGGDGAPAEDIQKAAEAISKTVIQQQRRQLRHMEEFEETFARAIELLDDEAARLIVFVDDLDRCLPEKAIEVLEAIKLFLEVEGVVFVLGMDQEIVRRGIEARYGGLFRQQIAKDGEVPIGGDVYLQKIVQIPFHLPALVPETVGDYIDKLGAGLSPRTRESFARGLHRNPRQVKRALNIFRLLSEVAAARVQRGALPEGAITAPLLAKTVVIQTQYPHLYQQWRLRPTLLITLEELYDRLGSRTAPAGGKVSPAYEMEDAPAAASSTGSGGNGILDRYLPDTVANLYLREMLTYPTLDDDEEGPERARFTGLKRHEMERYVRLEGITAAAAPEIMQAETVQVDLGEFLSGDLGRIREAAALLQEDGEERKLDSYRVQLVRVLEDESRSNTERVSAGNSLAYIGDPRFREDAWYLPDDGWLGFVRIPGGPFTMGSDPQRDPDARDDEQPPFEIDVPEFYMARFPVTVAQFRAYIEDSGTEPRDADSLKGLSNHPVVWVYWQEAVEYCQWLTAQLKAWPNSPADLRRLLERGWSVTLPTEPQWEKAARGAEGRLYPWGSAFGPERANTEEAEIGGTSAAGTFPGGKTPEGVADLGGNVWEWTRSEYRSYAERQSQTNADWSDAEKRPAVRGGSWYHEHNLSRCGARVRFGPGFRRGGLGFRVVLSPSVSDL